MKRIFGIALVLALIASLAFGTTALASEPIELEATGDGTAEWSDEEAAIGSYSAKLTMPAGTGWVNDNAEVHISISEAPKLSDITSWSFQATGQDAYYTPIEFYIDTNEDEIPDKVIVGQRMGSMTSDWIELNQANMSMYMSWKNGYEWLWDWSKVQEKYGDATLPRVDIGYGSLGSNKAITAYIDSFILGGIIYIFEPPPQPPPAPVFEPKPVWHKGTAGNTKYLPVKTCEGAGGYIGVTSVSGS